MIAGRVLRSEPLALAVAGEVAGWSRRAVHVLDRMTGAPGQLQSHYVPALHGVRGMLAAVADTRRRVRAIESDMVGCRELLRSMPTARPPGRVPPGPTESDAQLCEGITISARRLRALGSRSRARLASPYDHDCLPNEEARAGQRGAWVLAVLATPATCGADLFGTGHVRSGVCS
jgi:hypothetical protein